MKELKNQRKSNLSRVVSILVKIIIKHKRAIALAPISETRSLSLTQIQLNLLRTRKVTIFTRTLLSFCHLNPIIMLLNRCQNNPFHSQNEQQRYKQIFPIHNSVLLSIQLFNQGRSEAVPTLASKT